jgi:neutral trehalase
LNKRDFPKVHFYDQDFVDIYDRTWTWIQEYWHQPEKENGFGKEKFFNHPGETTINQWESTFSSFFLVYSNRIYNAHAQLDALYAKQEESGAIRWQYDLASGKPVFTKDNPEGVGMPLFAWAEYNLYHKTANKKRVKDVLPVLQKYVAWLEGRFKQPNGLYTVPLSATTMVNSPREKAKYLVDFNTAAAINALYISALGDIMNDKEISFQFKRSYFSLKTRINSLMWNQEAGCYFDLDGNEKQLRVRTIATFWPLLAEIPNEDRGNALIAQLTDPAHFGVEHPFPTLGASEKDYSPEGNGFRGSVLPPFTYMIIKGLEKYNRHELARECAIRHLYYVLDTLQPEGAKTATVWEGYKPQSDGPAHWPGRSGKPRAQVLSYAGLSTIALMIENIVGLDISLPRKTVDWIIPSLEIMGIENLSLKRNMITILSNKLIRGWEIHMESEKLYYFTINILGKKKKTLPIPSGKCSMLIDKL